MGVCQWCKGTGREYVEQGSSLCYACPDCNGSGFIPECDICGEEFEGEFCEDCYMECEECGTVVPISETQNGLCEDCI